MAVLLALANGAYAGLNETTKNSSYCESNSFDPLYLGTESMQMRTQKLAMTKERAFESRTSYCWEGANANDPICDPKMMNDTTKY